MLSIWLILTSIIVFFTGCETKEPTRIDGNLISNNSIGYDGFEITIPEGYYYSEDWDKSPWTKFLKAFSDKYIIRGGMQYDTVILGSYNQAICFIAAEAYTGSHVTFVDYQTGGYNTSINSFFLLNKEDRVTYLRHSVEDIITGNRINVERKVEMIGGRPVGIVSAKYPDRDVYTVEYMTLGELTEIYYILGVAADRRDELIEAMNSMVESLKVK